MNSEEQESVLGKVKDYTEWIAALIQERTSYMNENMGLFSKFQVGDPIYDRCGVRLGTVSRLYRYHSGRSPLLDTSMSVEVEYHTGNNCFDNTSRTGLGTLGFRTETECYRPLLMPPARWQ